MCQQGMEAFDVEMSWMLDVPTGYGSLGCADELKVVCADRQWETLMYG